MPVIHFHVTDDMIDRGAHALRNRQQGGKNLTPWDQLPNATKKKWREHVRPVLMAAAGHATPHPTAGKEDANA